MFNPLKGVLVIEESSSRIDQRKPDTISEKNAVLAMMEKRILQSYMDEV